MSDRTPTPDPRFDPRLEPDELRRLEDQLRTELTEETRSVRPPDRLEAILHQAREAGPVSARGGHGTRRWLVPLAAAAAVAAIIGGVWWAGQDSSTRTATPATSGPTAPQSSSAPSSNSTSPTTGTTSATTVPGAVSLPVYFVGPQGGSKPTWKLVREFVSRPTSGSDPAARAKAALVEAIQPPQLAGADAYLRPWSGQTIGTVTVAPKLITVDLVTAGDPQAAPTAEQRRLAVQELVWTAQAAVQKGNVPVRFTVQGRDARLFGSIPTAGRTFTRPPSDRLYEDLASIWVTSPTRDQVLPATTAVTVSGQAIVFEATVSWELTRDGTAVKNGHTMASVGAPEQGTYSIPLGTLTPGSYAIRVFEVSQADGQGVTAQRTVPFTVR